MNPIISPDGRFVINRDKIVFIDLGAPSHNCDFSIVFENGSVLSFKKTPEWRKILQELFLPQDGV